MKRSHLIFLIFLLVTVVLLEVAALTNLLLFRQNNQRIESNSNSAISQNTTFLTDPTIIYPETAWSKADKNAPNSLSISNNSLLYDSSGNQLDIPLEGAEWITTEKNLHNISSSSINNFEIISNKLLENADWRSSISLFGTEISVLSADRPGSSVWGYLKKTGDTLQIIILEYSIDYYGKATKENISDCPCDITARIFLSELIPIEQIKKSIDSK